MKQLSIVQSDSPPDWGGLSCTLLYGTQGRFLGSVLGPTLCIRHVMVSNCLSPGRLAGLWVPPGPCPN